MKDVLVTGGTGYIGRRLIAELLAARAYRVRALVRPASASKLPSGATAVPGDALDPVSVSAALHPADTLVHLVGTPHPRPSKAEEFTRVDVASVRASVAAAHRVGVAHVVYVSVAHPSSVMKAYQEAHIEGERAIAAAGLTATVLRPWYVLGPGHRWPVVLLPLYWGASLVPAWRGGARRLGLVTLRQMIRALVGAVEQPPPAGTIRVMEVGDIRRA